MTLVLSKSFGIVLVELVPSDEVIHPMTLLVSKPFGIILMELVLRVRVAEEEIH